jgi:hypothetical protein
MWPKGIPEQSIQLWDLPVALAASNAVIRTKVVVAG